MIRNAYGILVGMIMLRKILGRQVDRIGGRLSWSRIGIIKVEPSGSTTRFSLVLIHSAQFYRFPNHPSQYYVHLSSLCERILLPLSCFTP
jgi:hypothetical protein